MDAKRKPASSDFLRYLAGKFFSSPRFWYSSCVVVVTALLYWRRPDAFFRPQFWAEDGAFFFTNAWFSGARSLVTPFAGYFHSTARLVAWLGNGIPVRYAPHWYAFASGGILVMIVTYLFSARFPFRPVVKFLMGLALVATAVDNEVFFNLANWATLFSLFWLLLAISDEPRTRLQSIFDGMLLVWAGMDSPFVVCLWIVFLWRWIVRRTSHSRLLFLLSLPVVAIQMWNMLERAGTEGAVFSYDPLFLKAVVYRFYFLFLGAHVHHFGSFLTRFLVPGCVTVAAFYGYWLWDAGRRRNGRMFTVMAGGLAAATLSFYVLRHTPKELVWHSGRHFYLPAVTMAWALLLSDRWLKWPCLAALLAAFLFLTPRHKNQTLPDLDWAGHVARCTGEQPLYKIPINPVWDPPVWFVYMNSTTNRAGR